MVNKIILAHLIFIDIINIEHSMLASHQYCNFASLREKKPLGEFVSIRSTKNTGIAPAIRFGELSRPTSIQSGGGMEDQMKVVKLIGNQNDNIEEIISGLKCHCGCRAEFKKILVLLMGKIYKLREERNELRQLVKQGEKGKEKEKEDRGLGVGVGVNTEQDLAQQLMRAQLFKLINDSKLKSIQSEPQQLPPIDLAPILTENIFGPIPAINRETSITFEHEANETNLLSDSGIQLDKDSSRSKLSFESSEESQPRVLRECTNNHQMENRLGNLKNFCDQRSLNRCTLEEYIQKVNCARQLDKYETEKRKNIIF